MDMQTTLLTHAEDLARSRGYDGFSFADLAAGAGIRKASVHYHFPTKADLAERLMQVYTDRFFDDLADLVEEPTAGAALDRYLALYRDALKGGEAVCLCVAFSAMRDAIPPATQTLVEAFRTQSVAWLEALFRRAQEDGSVLGVTDPKAEAAACFALMEGAQIVARASVSPARFDEAVALLRGRIETGERA